MPYRPPLHSPGSDYLPGVPGRDCPPYPYRPQHRSYSYSSHSSQRISREEAPPWRPFRAGFSLVDDSGSSRGDDHTSIAGPLQFHSEFIYLSHHLPMSFQLPVYNRQVSSPVSGPSPSSFLSPPRFTIHQPSSSPITRSGTGTTPSTELSMREKHRGEIEAVENIPGVQARPLVSIFPDKNTQSQKKASSIAQSYYVPASCNPSSFPGNQSGPTSYTPCCDSEVINVHTSQASKPVHPSQQPRIPWCNTLMTAMH